MESEEKVKGKERKKEEIKGGKLKRGILLGEKGEGNSTPTTTWKFGLIQPCGQKFPSARKLGASLWEMEPQLNLLRVDQKMNRNLSHHHKQDCTNILEGAQAQGTSKQRTNGINLRKQLEPSQTQHNIRAEKVEQAQQPLSPSSCSSSMEMGRYRPAISPNSSLVSNRKLGQSSHGLRTSTELLKVLNRIWTLEEKHALDMSLVKTLRSELGKSQAQIQELLQEKKKDQNEIINLTERITELKIVRKRDQDRIRDAVRLLEEKFENELKLRRHSEKRHRKLAKELLEMKSSFSTALRELKREKRARTLLEDLCDEFAGGIRDYEQEVRFFMKQKSSKDQAVRDGNDRFILHISEAWLDERMQMKLANTRSTSEKQSPLDKLYFEIETFLREKNSRKNDRTPVRNSYESMRSLDTFHLNEPASAPWNVNEGDDSIGIISNRSLNPLARRPGHIGNLTPDVQFKKTAKQESTKSRIEDIYGKYNTETPKKGDMMQRSSTEGRISISDANVDLQDSTIRNSSFNYLEGAFDPSMFTGPPSPVKKWVSKVSAADNHEIAGSSSSSRWGKSVKLNTLKAKLMEARVEGKQSRARASRSSSKGD